MKTIQRSEAGFTLIELVIAMAVFSTLMMMSLPRFTDFQRAMAMKATTRNLATNFRLAQQRAASANRPCYMDFDLSKRFFTIWLDQDLDQTFDGKDEVRAVGFAYEDQVASVPGVVLPTGTTFKSTTFPTGLRGYPQVAFASDGSVANAGEVVIEDVGKRRYKVEVTLAGGITVAQEVGGKWIE